MSFRTRVGVVALAAAAASCGVLVAAAPANADPTCSPVALGYVACVGSGHDVSGPYTLVVVTNGTTGAGAEVACAADGTTVTVAVLQPVALPLGQTALDPVLCQ